MRLSRGLQAIHPLVLASFVIVIFSLKVHIIPYFPHTARRHRKNNYWARSHFYYTPRMTEAQEYLGDNSGELPRQKPLRLEDILPHQEKIYYDKMVPPKEDGKPTVVFFHVTVMSLDSIDESSMTFVADIFFGQSWKDGRLRMPSNMTSYRLIPVQFLQDLWRPDSFFKNAKKVTFQDMTIPNHYIWLHEDRSILYMVKLTLLLSCAMNFKTYPHDTQRCAMKIESLSHTVQDLVFVWDPKLPLDVNTKIELPQLDLVSSETGDCTQEYLTGNFTCVEVVFTFKRRLGYYLFHTYVPTCLIVIMSWISFWIKPEAVPARVTLGVTSLLTLSTQHANSQKSLPPVSYIKAIDIFMSTCTIFVFFSLMEYAIVNILMGDFVDSGESLLQRSLRNVRGGITRTFRPTRRRTPPAEQIPMNGESLGTPPSEGEHLHGHSSSHQLHHHLPPMAHSTRIFMERQEARREKAILIDRLSRVLFPLTFAIFNFAYWTISLSMLNAPTDT